jgi:Fur family transcriptional regulator, ferric uptake regulator
VRTITASLPTQRSTVRSGGLPLSTSGRESVAGAEDARATEDGDAAAARAVHHAGMEAADRLRDEGYRLTPQRQLVWEALRRADHHLTAEQIRDQVSLAVPDFNLASVYRTLTLLTELDLVKEVRLGDRRHWEVAHPDDEFHLVCRSCRRVAHHRGTLVASLRAHLSEEHGFDVEDVDLVVHGVCATCREAAPA